MGREGKLVLVLFLGILLVQFVNAIETDVTINTLPEHRVDVRFYEPGERLSALESFSLTSDQNGVAALTYSGTTSEFDIIVWVKKDNVLLVKHIFDESFPVGQAINLEVFEAESKVIVSEGEVVAEENVTTNETVVEEVVEESSSDITGDVVESDLEADSSSGGTGSSTGDFFSSSLFYLLAGIVALLVIVLTTAKVTQHRMSIAGSSSTGGHIKVVRIKKLSDLKKEKKVMEEERTDKIDDFKDTIDDAEKKIKEAQEEIKRLRDRDDIKIHEDKIAAAKKKLQEDERALLALRKGKKEDKE